MTAPLPCRRTRPLPRRTCATTDHRGMTTAEWALGTVAVVAGVGALVAVLAEPTAPMQIFWPLLERLLAVILRVFGAG